MHNSFSDRAPSITLNDIIADTEFNTSEAKTFTAIEAYEKVLEGAGSSFSRDDIDKRLIEEVNTGTAQFKGLSPLNNNQSKMGIIDSQDDLKPTDAPSNWSAWPVLMSLDTPLDTDGDGMPDEWEINKKLDHKTPDSDGNHLSTAYDNIEVYLNELVKHILNRII